MPRTPVRSRTLDLAAMTPGAGLTPTAEGWHVALNMVEFATDAPLPPGWYRLRVNLRSAARRTLRKRLELAFSHGERETLAWTAALEAETMIELPRGSAGVTVTLVHAVGNVEVTAFQLKRVSGPALSVAAMREKLRLLKAYRNLGPVLLRGGRLLAKARFGEFHRRVLKGLRDRRVMLAPDGATPTSEIDDGNTWVRRHALPAQEAARVRAACDALADPPFLAVLMPVTDATLAEARLAARAVVGQAYPHWELLIAGSGSRRAFAEFAALAKRDGRVRVNWADGRDGLAVALGRAAATAEAERVLVLPPSAELAEDALFRWATAVKDADAIAGSLNVVTPAGEPEVHPVWLTRFDKLPDDAPAGVSASDLAAWATANIPESERSRCEAVAYPLDERPFMERARLAAPPSVVPQRLSIATDLIGINGWGHVAYAVLRGLPSFGVEFDQHPATRIKAGLLPPAFVPEARARTPHDRQLAIVPPFLLPRFGPDRNTAVFTMWETDTIPPAAVESLNRTGLVMVPSEWNRSNFRRCGVTVPIEVVPLGFDRTTYRCDRSWPEVCTFGTAGALSAGGLRKNVGAAVELFRAAFPTEPDVRLRLKITPDSPPVETFGDPRIDLIQTILPHAEMVAWYRSVSAFVNTSFGEGFGLHLIEAMACGRPVVTPDYSGLTAFFAPELGYAVDFDLEAVSNDIYTGRWAVPRGASVIAAMRQVYADQGEARRRGQLSADRARRFHWKHAGRALHAALVKHGFLTDAEARK